MKIFRPNRFDKDIVGWFFDNELAWWGEKIAGQGKYGLVDAVAKLPPEHTANFSGAFSRRLAGGSIIGLSPMPMQTTSGRLWR